MKNQTLFLIYQIVFLTQCYSSKLYISYLDEKLNNIKRLEDKIDKKVSSYVIYTKDKFDDLNSEIEYTKPHDIIKTILNDQKFINHYALLDYNKKENAQMLEQELIKLVSQSIPGEHFKKQKGAIIFILYYGIFLINQATLFETEFKNLINANTPSDSVELEDQIAFIFKQDKTDSDLKYFINSFKTTFYSSDNKLRKNYYAEINLKIDAILRLFTKEQQFLLKKNNLGTNKMYNVVLENESIKNVKEIYSLAKKHLSEPVHLSFYTFQLKNSLTMEKIKEIFEIEEELWSLMATNQHFIHSFKSYYICSSPDVGIISQAHQKYKIPKDYNKSEEICCVSVSNIKTKFICEYKHITDQYGDNPRKKAFPIVQEKKL